MQAPVEVVIGLGSNVGSREALLRAALDLLATSAGVALMSRSKLHESAPVGPPQPRYLNAAALLRTTLEPTALMSLLLEIERSLGRERRERWGPRTLDLDCLWIRDTQLSIPSLTVPHAELLGREFTLRPLLEVCPDAVDPRDGAPLARALAALTPDASMTARPFEEAFPLRALLHTADEGFVTTGSNRADLLAASAEAMGSLIVDPQCVAPSRCVPVSVSLDAEAGDDERMFSWLSEVLYHLDAGRLALRRAVVFDDGPEGVRGALFGDDLDEEKHAVRSALKAVTWHALEVGPDREGCWRAQVVIDV